MDENKFFQKVIPEIMHPNPLASLSSINAIVNGNEVVWEASNIEPRIPYDLADAFPDFSLLPKEKTKRLIFCTGQVYYQLLKARAYNKVDDTAIIRIEQLAPFPFVEIKHIIDFYAPSVESIIWCQEEPLNHGAWSFVCPRINTSIKNSDWYSSGKVLFSQNHISLANAYSYRPRRISPRKNWLNLSCRAA